MKHGLMRYTDYEVECQYHSALMCLGGRNLGAQTARDAAKEARQHGWRKLALGWACPACCKVIREKET